MLTNIEGRDNFISNAAWIDSDGNYHCNDNSWNNIAISADKLERIGWQEPEIVLNEKFLEKIREEISKVLVENDPLRQLEEIEVPSMPGFVEI